MIPATDQNQVAVFSLLQVTGEVVFAFVNVDVDHDRFCSSTCCGCCRESWRAGSPARSPEIPGDCFDGGSNSGGNGFCGLGHLTDACQAP
jgi:hypothetical protein